MNRTRTVYAVNILKIISSKTRFQIVSMLLNSEKKTPCVNEIADTIGISHSATSHQLAKLEDKGVVNSHRTGKTICYKIKNNETTKLLRSIITILTDTSDSA